MISCLTDQLVLSMLVSVPSLQDGRLLILLLSNASYILLETIISTHITSRLMAWSCNPATWRNVAGHVENKAGRRVPADLFKFSSSAAPTRLYNTGQQRRTNDHTKVGVTSVQTHLLTSFSWSSCRNFTIIGVTSKQLYLETLFCHEVAWRQWYFLDHDLYVQDQTFKISLFSSIAP